MYRFIYLTDNSQLLNEKTRQVEAAIEQFTDVVVRTCNLLAASEHDPGLLRRVCLVVDGLHFPSKTVAESERRKRSAQAYNAAVRIARRDVANSKRSLQRFQEQARAWARMDMDFKLAVIHVSESWNM